jgi:hypothetical protein
MWKKQYGVFGNSPALEQLAKNRVTSSSELNCATNDVLHYQ